MFAFTIHIHFKSTNKQQQLLIAFFMRLCAHTQIETESAVKYCRRHRRRRRCQFHRHYSPRKLATTIRWNSAAAAATLRRARAQKANWIHWIRDSCRSRRSRDHPKVLSNNNNISTRRSAGTKRTQPSATLCCMTEVDECCQHSATFGAKSTRTVWQQCNQTHTCCVAYKWKTAYFQKSIVGRT